MNRDFSKEIENDRRKWKRLIPIWIFVVLPLLLVGGCIASKRRITVPAPPGMVSITKEIPRIPKSFQISEVVVEAIPGQPKVFTVWWIPRGVRYDKWTVDNWKGPHIRYVIEKKVNWGAWQLVGYESQNTYIRVTNDFQNVIFRVGIQEY
jgi:hypothetical protein